MANQNKKILLGMSGGVDSSVAAFLLKNEDYDVYGCTLCLYKKDKQFSEDDAKDARLVAEALGISHFVRDFSSEFEESVIKYFADTYYSGGTPNPCTFCNKNVKFPSLLSVADEFSADFVATGHYARILKQNDRYLLLKGVDPKKDQSYMLYSLSQTILSKTVFPLGSLTKEQIREIAIKQNLPVASKKDSQDICFIKDTDYVTFLKEHDKREVCKGKFKDLNGKVLGDNKGVVAYTIGQRKGLGISSEAPYYVVSKDALNNTVVLGREKDLYTNRVFVKDANYIAFGSLSTSLKASAKLRYSQTESACTVHPTEDGFCLEFDSPQRAVTPGQSAVLYDGETVLGGGIIM